MARIHKSTSQYLDTPIKDFYLDIMSKRVIPPNANDRIISIDAKYNLRPDLFANDYFGSPRLWWILVARNMDVLIDPIADFKTGVQIFVPNSDIVQDLA